MEEENIKKDEGEKEEPTPADAGEGNKPQTTPLIDQANAAAERLEKSNQELKEQLDRQEEFAAKQALGGKAEAGMVTQKEKEVDDNEYGNRALKGEENPLEL